MRISDWSSDVCSSDLRPQDIGHLRSELTPNVAAQREHEQHQQRHRDQRFDAPGDQRAGALCLRSFSSASISRSEEHTSELQSLMRISYAVFCLKKNYNL